MKRKPRERHRHEPLCRAAGSSAYEPGRNNKLRLIADYFRAVPDPDRGYALAALTGALSFQHAKAGLIRTLISERSDPVLFALSYDYVGDLSETVALMWPTPSRALSAPPTPDPSPPLASLAGVGEQARRVEHMHPHSPKSSPRSPRSARRNCRNNSRNGSMNSMRPAAGRS